MFSLINSNHSRCPIMFNLVPKKLKVSVLWNGDGWIKEYDPEQQPYDDSHARSYSYIIHYITDLLLEYYN